jgi:hypothetical protein
MARRRTIRPRQWSVSSAGPFTATLVTASNLPVGSGVVVIFSSLAHLTASARAFAPGHHARYPAGYAGRLPGGGRPSRPGFPLRFRCRRSLLGHPIPGGELGLRHGRLTGDAGPRTGLPRSARTSCDRGGCPLYPEDGGAHPGQGTCSAGACRSMAASPDHPAPASHRQGSASRGINEGLRDSPVRSSLACGRAGGTGSPWASPRASHPAVVGDARRGWDRPSSTDLELHAHIRLILQSGRSLVSCDLASHRPQQASRGSLWGLPHSPEMASGDRSLVTPPVCRGRPSSAGAGGTSAPCRWWSGGACRRSRRRSGTCSGRVGRGRGRRARRR